MTVNELAVVSHNAELMYQPTTTTAIDPKSMGAFIAVHGGQSRHMLFAIGSDHKFNLLQPDETKGGKDLIDLSACFGLAEGTQVRAHAAVQEPEKNTIFVVFSAVTAGANPVATLYVVKPTSPDDWYAVEKGQNLTSWLFAYTGNEDHHLNINQIHLNTIVEKEHGYPLAAVSYTKASNSRPDIIRLQVTAKSNSWTYNQDLELPVDADEIHCIRVGHLRSDDSDDQKKVYRGIFVLYSQDKRKRIMYKSTSDSDNPSTNWDITPPDNNIITLETLVNPEGLSHLVMGGDYGLYHYEAEWFQREGGSKYTPKPINTGPHFRNAKQILVAQTKSGTTIWAENGKRDVNYQQYDIGMKAVGEAFPVCSNAEGGGDFSALLDNVTKTQKLFIIDKNGHMRHWTQNKVHQYWDHTSVLVPNSRNLNNVPTYTTHISVRDNDGNPIINANVRLHASASITVTLNADEVVVGTEGVDTTTDSRGFVTVIHRVSDIAPVIFTLKDAIDSPKPVIGQEYHANPAHKVHKKLSEMKTGAHLRNAVNKNGRRLITDPNVTDQHLDTVAQHLQKLVDHADTLPKDGSLQSSNRAQKVVPPEDTKHHLWDFFHTVVNGIEDAGKFSIKLYDGLLHFVVDVFENGLAAAFVLDCLPQVLKAISAVLDTVIQGIENIMDYFGCLFDWDDILETHDSIVNFANGVVDRGHNCLKSAKGNAKSWFGDLRTKVKSLDKTNPKLQTICNTKREKPALASDDPKNKFQDALSSPDANWLNHHMEHGGGREAVKEAQTVHAYQESSNPFADFEKRFLNQLQETLNADFQKLCDDLKKCFPGKSSKPFSLGDLLTSTALDILISGIDILEGIVLAIFELVDEIAIFIQNAMNHELDIPLLSTLYTSITKGKNKEGKKLTVLEFVALLVAFPATVIFKVIHGESPAESRRKKELMESKEPPKPEVPDKDKGIVDIIKDNFLGAKKILDPVYTIALMDFNAYLVLSAPASWVEDEAEVHFTFTGFVTTLLDWGLSVPFDDTPAGFDKWANWGVGSLTVIAEMMPSAELKAILNLLVAMGQVTFVAGIIGDDVFQHDKVLPGKNALEIALNIDATINNQTSKILALMATLTRQPELIAAAEFAGLNYLLLEFLQFLDGNMGLDGVYGI